MHTIGKAEYSHNGSRVVVGDDERMREAARREAISMQIFSCLVTEKQYGLAYCVDNAFFALCSEEEQLRCFETAASVLERDGFFVVEAKAPTP